MKHYSFLFESIGRNLVGASRFSSRKSVAQTIMQQYPQPQMLADKLQQMAEASYGKEKETLLNLSLKCRGLDMNSYPAFAKQISGFSSIWKYIGGAAATAGAAAGIKYLANKANDYVTQQNPDATFAQTSKAVYQGVKSDIKKIPGVNTAYQYYKPHIKNVNQKINNGMQNMWNNYKARAMDKYIQSTMQQTPDLLSKTQVTA